mgnify:CR=1 FL=1
MKLFITGSKGFIGHELVRQCQENGIEVIGADRADGFDIREKSAIDHIPQKVDAIIHLASLSSDTFCRGNEYECFDNNVMGTLNLMQAAVTRKAKQFIFASTEWVYDNCTSEQVKTEESPINIANHTSEYALSKLVSEANLRQKYQQGFCPTTILRFGIVCGSVSAKKSAVESLFLAVKDKNEIQVGSLQTGRCFIHVSDIASGIIKSLGLDGFHIINLAGDRLITLHDIIETSKQILGRNPKIVETDPHNVSVRNISNAKAKKMLGWKPEMTVDTWLENLRSLV